MRRAIIAALALLCCAAAARAQRSPLARHTLSSARGGSGVGVGGGDVVAVITVSRASGVAPFYVEFESEGTTIDGDANEWRNGRYSWDFDDAGAGTWALTGASKEIDYGPIAAHVFETPGVYTVQLQVTSLGAIGDTDTIEITVTDPDDEWPGTDTVCVSTSGTFSGCPAGAEQLTTSTMSAIQSEIVDDRRALLRCAETWSTSSSPALTIASGIDIGYFGEFGTNCTGSNHPIVEMTASTGHGLIIAGDDWRVADIDFRAPGADAEPLVRDNANHLLVMDVVVTSGVSGFVSIDNNEYGRHTGFIDSTVVLVGHNGLYISAQGMAVMGVHVQDTFLGEHSIRFWHYGPIYGDVDPGPAFGLIAHSRFERAHDGHHNMKLMCADRPLDPGFDVCRRLMVYDNIVIGGANSVMVDIGPVDATNANYTADYIVDGNLILASEDGSASGSTRGIYARGVNGTVRNNICNGTGNAAFRCVNVVRRNDTDPPNAEPDPEDIKIYNNTAYSCEASGTLYGVSIIEPASNVSVFNNFTASACGITPTSILGTAEVSGNNVTSTSSGAFVDTTPGVTDTDFRIDTGSAAYNAGTTPPGAWMDRDLHTSPNGAHDVGAFEYVP